MIITVVSSVLEGRRRYQRNTLKRKGYLGHETISRGLPGVLVDLSKSRYEAGWPHQVGNAQREGEGGEKFEGRTFRWVPQDLDSDPLGGICIQDLDENRIIMKSAHDTELGKVCCLILNFYFIRLASNMHSMLHSLMEHLLPINWKCLCV